MPNQFLSRVKAFINKVTTAQETKAPDPGDTMKQNVTVRDLKPEKDADGGASIARRESRSGSGRTGEIDFMKDVQ